MECAFTLDGTGSNAAGWRWSECIKPIVGGERCQARHVGLLQSGTMHVVHDDGTEQEIAPGHAYVIEPGHDAWVVGRRARRGVRVATYRTQPPMPTTKPINQRQLEKAARGSAAADAATAAAAPRPARAVGRSPS
jgi:hypothetical protein